MKLTTGLAAACLSAFALNAAAQYTMKLSTPSLNDTNHEWMKQFKAGLEARVGSKIKVEIYPANQLGQVPRVQEGISLGTIELGMSTPGFMGSVEPRFLVTEIPGLFDGIVHGQQVLADPEMRKRLKTFGESRNVEPLWISVNGPAMLLSHKAVRAVADLQGLKIRAPGGSPLHVEPLKALGASPLQVALNDALAAMQNKGIDGMISGFNILTSFKYYDIAKDASEVPGSFLIGLGLVSRSFWKTIGPELEGIVREESIKAERVFSTFGVEDLERIRAIWRKNGGTIHVFSPAEEKKYVGTVLSALPPIFAASPQLKEDYEFFSAMSKKYRK